MPIPHGTDLAAVERARSSLEGLSVGDAFGEQFFNAAHVDGIPYRSLPPAPWGYTDDTEMALSVFGCLRERGSIDQEQLARSFAERYDGSRGYGPAMHRLLENIRLGSLWRSAAGWLFEGQGSWGNGAATRVAPLGALFADDLDQAVEQARLSAEVTHAHPEGIAGAIAVAAAAAWAARLGTEGRRPEPREHLDLLLPLVPNGLVREGLRHARDLAPGCSVRLAVAALGNGTQLSAQDTVPFALWCAAYHLDDYEQALWLTVSGLGDRDTTCAITGGVVAAYTGADAIPAAWRQSREPLPPWPFE
jgi:ADP-ribosylglycohydrolase